MSANFIADPLTTHRIKSWYVLYMSDGIHQSGGWMEFIDKRYKKKKGPLYCLRPVDQAIL